MNITSTRPAFSMITAIFVIMIMATVSIFVLDIAGKAVQETTAQYRKEQAILYAKSYTEFAVMAASSQDCIRHITADINGKDTTSTGSVRKGKGYRVEIDIYYIGNDNGCNSNYFGGTVTTDASKGASIIIDTFVRYRNPDHPNSKSDVTWATNPGYTYHRRTLQRL